MSPEPRHRAGALRPWWDACGLLAVVLMVAQALWRGVHLGRGFYTQDDFVMLRLGSQPLSWDLLLYDYSGHLFPGGFVLAWAHAQAAPLDWGTSVAAVLLLQAAAAVLAWLVLTRLLPGRWVRLPVFAVFLASPLSLWSTQWWAVAIQYLPVTAFLLLAVWSFLPLARPHAQLAGRGAGPALGTVAATVGALLFQERGVLVPLVVAGVAVALTDAPGPLRRVTTAFRAHLGLWLALAAVVLGYLVAHRVLAPIATTSAGSPEDGAELVGNFVARNVVPGLVGGPWRPDVLADSLVVPPWWAVGVAAAVALVLVVVTCVAGGATARWGWLMLAVYVLADVALLFGGRTGMGPSFGMIPRYAADVVPVAMVALALAVRDIHGPLRLRIGRRHVVVPSARARRRVPAPLLRPALPALLATVAYLASAAVTTEVMAPHLYNRADRDYVETLRAELREQPRAVLYDGPVPEDLMIGWFGPDQTVSTVVGLAPENPVFDVPSSRMRVVDASGRLREIDVRYGTRARRPADRTCGYRVDTRGVDVPFREEVPEGRRLLRLGYYTGAPGFVRLEAGDQSWRVPVEEGLGAVDIVVDGGFDRIRLEAEEADQVVCVPSAEAGVPVPRDAP